MNWLSHLLVGILLTLDASLVSGQKKKAALENPSAKKDLNTTPGDGSATPATASTPSKPVVQKSDVPSRSTHELKPDGKIFADTEAAVASLTEKVGLNKLVNSRILVVLPLPFFSHTINYLPIFKELARRGHNITMVSPYPQKDPLPNWEDIVTENTLEKMLSMFPTKDFTEVSQSFLDKVMGMLWFSSISVELLGEMPQLRELYEDNSRQFDLVFVEAQFIQEPLLAFGWKFKAPVISLFPSYIEPNVAYYTGNPVFTSNYVPNMYFPSSKNMNLYQRIENTAYTVLKLITYIGIQLPKMDSHMKKLFPSEDRPYIADLLFNVSFTLLDSNPVLSYPYPRANNIREFLGINTKSDAPLSPELQKLMDEADKEGVLLFTLGSHYQTSTLKPHVLQSIVYALSNIPQKVIMKWDKEERPQNLTSNVHTVKWVPQVGILRHKNCRAFFTHSGVHGVMEAMEHGVPLISFPLFADQQFFGTWAEVNGAGKILDYKTITPQIALATVKEVLNNPKYKENAVAVSVKLKDVPQPTLDEVIYWVEHVIRTKGAPHLRPGSLSLWWYQRFGLDVLAVAFVIILVPIWLLSAIIKCLSSVCRRKSKTNKNEKKYSKSKKDS